MRFGYNGQKNRKELEIEYINNRLYLDKQRLNQCIQENVKGYLKGWWKSRNKNVCIYRTKNLNDKIFNIEKTWEPIVSIIRMIVLQQKFPNI
jgi:hypothetical protein